MTSSRYIIERLAQAFGYDRKAQRLGEAASEMHLLREAEAQLGGAVWDKTEAIEALGNEYWNLRKLSKAHAELTKRIEACQQRLEAAEDERASLINKHASEADPVLETKRSELLAKLEGMSKKREEITNEGRGIRRLYNGAKTKLEVLSTENEVSSEEISNIKDRLDQLKARFNELKEQRDSITEAIREGDAEMDAIAEKLQVQTEKNQEVAAEAFKVINQVNKEVWQLRAESGLIETRMHQLHAEIGRYVSRHAKHDAACKSAAAAQHGLVDVMRALRRSIALNHRLAGS